MRVGLRLAGLALGALVVAVMGGQCGTAYGQNAMNGSATPVPTISSEAAAMSMMVDADSGIVDTSAGEGFEKADTAYNENQLDNALQLYTDGLKKDPGNMRARARVMEIQLILRGPGSAAAAGAMTAVKGGTTSVTRDLPSELAELAEARKKYQDLPEFRGAWVTRFDWVSKDPAEMTAKIKRTMQDAKGVGLNAVVFQVRHEAATLYPSKLEPWSWIIGGKDPGFDPVKLAIDEAHAAGLEFHAYMNPCPVSDERSGPANPNHIFNKHCRPGSNPNWLVYQGGKPAPFHEYYWLNVNLPEVQTYIRYVVLDFVSRYDIDGVHFDRIRFPTGNGSDDPWSKARHQGAGNPLKLQYSIWQRENITRMLTDLYGAISAVKPNVKVSSAVWGIYDNKRIPGYAWTSCGLRDYLQDSIGWINRGCMDAIVPMIYWNIGGNKPDYDELLLDFHNSIGNGRHVYGGQMVFSNVEMMRQVLATNMIGAQGTCPFTLNSIVTKGLAPFYRTAIYPNDVKTPVMPWKEKPTKGIVLVRVRNKDGFPVMDAEVRMPGRNDVWLSSADGFCAIVDAAPKTGVVLAAETATGMQGASKPFDVVPGKPVTVQIQMR